MNESARILRRGAQQLRERCAPIPVWRRVEELAEAVERGERLQAPKIEMERPTLAREETPDD